MNLLACITPNTDTFGGAVRLKVVDGNTDETVLNITTDSKQHAIRHAKLFAKSKGIKETSITIETTF